MTAISGLVIIIPLQMFGSSVPLGSMPPCAYYAGLSVQLGTPPWRVVGVAGAIAIFQRRGREGALHEVFRSADRQGARGGQAIRRAVAESLIVTPPVAKLGCAL